METLRLLVALGLTGLLVLLRLDADAFGVGGAGPLGAAGRAGPWEAGGGEGSTRSSLWRLSWYALAIVFLAAVAVLLAPAGVDLHLQVGSGAGAVVAGLAYGIVGMGAVAAVARWRWGSLQLPRFPSLVAWAPAVAEAVDGVAGAAVDEALFRGVLLGWSLAVVAAIDGDPMVAVLVVALVDLLVTRAAAPGRGLDAVAFRLAIALLGGWLTLSTGGIGAAVLGHALTRIGFTVVASGETQMGRWRVAGEGNQEP
jgi:hypothetical protein